MCLTLIGRIEVRRCRGKSGVKIGLQCGGQAQREMPFISLYIYASDKVCVHVCVDVHPCECMCLCFCQDGGLGVGVSPGGCLIFMRWAGRWPSGNSRWESVFALCVCEGEREEERKISKYTTVGMHQDREQLS